MNTTHTHGRYELRADHTDWLDVRDPQGYRNTINQPGAIALIRQQARDIAELEVFAEIGRQWNSDSSLAKWFPLTAERVEQDAQEIAKLRTDLAAAVAERSEYWGALHSTRDELFKCRANQRTLESELRITRDQRDTLRARLAAIDNAPTVAVVCSSHSFGQFVQQRFFGSQLPRIGTELIARPAKD